ncbi:MAG: spondin domain-containing protein [Burkholderiaceae bacterium]|nr:spondin domain-containing protein [Burkholderiaceae bacterium]
MSLTRPTLSRLTSVAAAAAFGIGTAAAATSVNVTVKIENLAPTNSVSYAPLHVGFHNGSFDAFDLGMAAGAGIVSVAEGGAGGQWQADFMAADPTAVRGTIGGLLQPGGMQSMSFVVDPLVNRYFTFASMVVPSNDFFIGNDLPTEYMLFNGAGQLQTSTITLRANQIWDAGSEVFDPAAAAFVGNNGLRSDQNSVVAFNFAEFFGYNGLGTGAGYTFDSQLNAGTDVYRISFTAAPVPEPESYALMLAGLGSIGLLARHRRRPA